MVNWGSFAGGKTSVEHCLLNHLSYCQLLQAIYPLKLSLKTTIEGTCYLREQILQV